MRLNRKQVISQQKCCEILRFRECIGGAFLVLFKYYCMQLILLLLFSILVILPRSVYLCFFLIKWTIRIICLHVLHFSFTRQPATLFRPSACVSPVCLFSAPYLPLLFDVSACWYDWTINNSELKNKNTNKNKKLIHRRLRAVLRAIGSVDVSGGDGAAVVCLLFRPPATELNKIIDKN